MKIISIITVCKNSFQTIENTIKSVLSQKTSDIEYIIIDGGSTDETVSIIKKYDGNIDYWLSEPDNGIYDAMNKGIIHARGEYLYFLNSDDWLQDGCIQSVLMYINRMGADVYYGHVKKINADKQTEWIPETLDRLWWWMPFGHQGVFVRKDLNLKFDDSYRIAADYKMMLELYASGAKFCYLPIGISYFGQFGISNTDIYSMCTEQVAIASSTMLKYWDKASIYADQIIDLYVKTELHHQFEISNSSSLFGKYLLNELKYCDNVVCFGTGCYAEQNIRIIEKSGVSIKYLLDNDLRKQGEKWHGYDVFSLNRLNDTNYYDIGILILTEKYSDEIISQIDGMRIEKNINIIVYKEIIDGFLCKYREELICIGRDRISSFNELCNKHEGNMNRHYSKLN